MKTSRVLTAIWNCPLNCGVRIGLLALNSGHVARRALEHQRVPSLVGEPAGDDHAVGVVRGVQNVDGDLVEASRPNPAA